MTLKLTCVVMNMWSWVWSLINFLSTILTEDVTVSGMVVLVRVQRRFLMKIFATMVARYVLVFATDLLVLSMVVLVTYQRRFLMKIFTTRVQNNCWS